MQTTRRLHADSNAAYKHASLTRRWGLRVSPLITGLVLCLSFSAAAIEPSTVSLDKRLQDRPSVDEVARQISQKPHWRILSAEPTVEDEKTLYRFKLLDKKRGRVQVIIIDPDKMPDLTKLP